MGTGIEVQGGKPQAAAVSGIGKKVVGASADYVKEQEDVSVDDEKLLELGVLRSKESISDVCLGVELSREQQNEIMWVLGKREEIFTYIPGKTSIIEHRVHLIKDRPIRCWPYVLPYAVRGEIQEEIQKMINTGIVRESNSPYASPMVVVKKKDGSNRICVDYRKLNRITVTDPEPMTTAEDLFEKLGQCQFFSKIDLSTGYWQIPVAHEDIHKTAFVTGDGCYEFLRMPFCIKNSGAMLVRGMRKLLHGFDHVESYIDDLIVYTKDWDTHLQVLDEHLRRLQQARLAVRPTKCLFGSKSVEFLGHLLVAIVLPSTILEKIRQAKRFNTKKKVRSFLGLADYYRDHIPSFAAIASPLSDLRRKGLPRRVRWDEPQEKAFVTPRESLLRRPVVRLPYHAKPFVLRSDASNCGLGVALMQEHDEKHYPVEFSSKKLTSATRRYSTLEKKCLAIVWGVSKFRLYLAGEPFIIQTDRQPVTFLNDVKFKNYRIMRWALALQGYDYTVKDIRGKTMC